MKSTWLSQSWVHLRITWVLKEYWNLTLPPQSVSSIPETLTELVWDGIFGVSVFRQASLVTLVCGQCLERLGEVIKVYEAYIPNEDMEKVCLQMCTLRRVREVEMLPYGIIHWILWIVWGEGRDNNVVLCLLQCFSTCGPNTNSVRTTWEFIRNAN